MRRWRLDVLAIGLLGVLVGALIVRWGAKPAPPSPAWPVTAIARRVDPSVVMVINQVARGGRLHPKGLGSGVVLSSNGIIVTNYHVVQGANALVVVLSNGRRYRARVVGVDPPTDLAVLRISAPDLTPIALGNSRDIQPGDLVVAIGNALGLSHTVTAGIVSARDRTLYRDGWEYHLIQTDAAINPGNSGGALVNSRGQLIGINSSKIARTGVEALGFAIPVNTVRTVVDQILRYGHVRRPWIGVQVAGGDGPGVVVVEVLPGSPAARAGVRVGDFITRIGQVAIKNPHDMIHALERAQIGQSETLTVLRGGVTYQLKVRLGDRNAAGNAA